MLKKISIRARLLVLVFISFPFTGLLWGQGELSLILGISNYQGELASYSTQNGFRALIGPVFGIHGGYELSPRFQLRADLLYTRLSGDDALNENEMTRSRNLDFFSPVVQLAGGVDWNLLSFSATKEKDFTPYATAGASLFYMDPRTVYQGETVRLRPLGTEGQYMDKYPDQKPYSLIQPSLQFGGGLKLITGGFIIALEAMLSYTFTDHLDDVGTIYISYPELYEEASPLTAALANRSGEYFNSEPVIVSTGSLRGNPDTKDLFGTITARLGVPLQFNSDQFKVRNKGSKRIRCPKF